jgi:23S rRNA pseudouridine2605 synthase
VQRTGSREPQRIAKLLARAGVASRREIERMIAEGRIAIDGSVIDTPATLLPSLRGVTVDGDPVQEATPARLFLFHKPAGVLTAARDPAGRATIYDRLPSDLPRLMPVGRLDLNTEGLLLMTTDGELKRQLELPSTGVERAYRARAYGAVTQEQLEELIQGVEIEGIRYGSIDANLERRTGANVWIEMILTEGKNREVRRVLEYLGLRVSRLIRTRYGPFILSDLPEGAIGEVRQHDLVAFRQSLGRARATEVAREQPIAVSGNAPRRVPRPKTVQPSREQAPRSTREQPRSERQAREAAVQTSLPRSRPEIARDRPTLSGAAETTTKRALRSAREQPERGRPARATAQSTTPRPARAPIRKPEVREELDTRPAAGEAPARKPRPKKGAGWAKAKPKARPGKPKRPRA